MTTNKTRERLSRLGLLVLPVLFTLSGGCKFPDGVSSTTTEVDWTIVQRELELTAYDLEAAAEYLDEDKREDALKIAGFMKAAATALKANDTGTALDAMQAAVDFAEAVAEQQGGASDDLRLLIDATKSAIRRVRAYSSAPESASPVSPHPEPEG